MSEHDLPWGTRVVDANAREGVTCGDAASGRVLVMFDDALKTGAVPVPVSELARATPMTDYDRGYRDGLRNGPRESSQGADRALRPAQAWDYIREAVKREVNPENWPGMGSALAEVEAALGIVEAQREGK